MTPPDDATAKRWMQQFLKPHYISSAIHFNAMDDVISVDRAHAPKVAGRLAKLAGKLAQEGCTVPVVFNDTSDDDQAATPGEVRIRYRSMHAKHRFYALIGEAVRKQGDVRQAADQALYGEGFDAVSDASGFWTDLHQGNPLDPETLRAQYRSGRRGLN